MNYHPLESLTNLLRYWISPRYIIISGLPRILRPYLLFGAGLRVAMMKNHTRIGTLCASSWLAPVSEDDAAKMIEQVKGLAPIRVYRGTTNGECAALARNVSDFS